MKTWFLHLPDNFLVSSGLPGECHRQICSKWLSPWRGRESAISYTCTPDNSLKDFACVRAKSLQHVQLFVTPWIGVHQAPLSMGFSRKVYWSVWPCPSPGDLPYLGKTHTSYIS